MIKIWQQLISKRSFLKERGWVCDSLMILLRAASCLVTFLRFCPGVSFLTIRGSGIFFLFILLIWVSSIVLGFLTSLQCRWCRIISLGPRSSDHPFSLSRVSARMALLVSHMFSIFVICSECLSICCAYLAREQFHYWT